MLHCISGSVSLEYCHVECCLVTAREYSDNFGERSRNLCESFYTDWVYERSIQHWESMINAVSQLLCFSVSSQFQSSLGCVQPCGVYRYLLSIISHWQAISTAGPKVMPHCQDHCVPVFGEHRFGARSISFSWFFGISFCEDGNELCREDTVICGLAAVI